MKEKDDICLREPYIADSEQWILCVLLEKVHLHKIYVGALKTIWTIYLSASALLSPCSPVPCSAGSLEAGNPSQKLRTRKRTVIGNLNRRQAET